MLQLKQIRQNARLTQSYLANKIGISQQTYANYENELTQAPYEILVKVADFYKISIDDLFGREKQNIHENTIIDNNLSIPEDRRELVKMIISLDTNDIGEISALIKGYIAGKSGNSNFQIFN